MHRGDSMTARKRSQLLTLVSKQDVAAEEDRTHSSLFDSRERPIDLGRVAGI
jgi:hypothetical protein